MADEPNNTSTPTIRDSLVGLGHRVTTRAQAALAAMTVGNTPPQPGQALAPPAAISPEHPLPPQVQFSPLSPYFQGRTPVQAGPELDPHQSVPVPLLTPDPSIVPIPSTVPNPSIVPIPSTVPNPSTNTHPSTNPTPTSADPEPSHLPSASATSSQWPSLMTPGAAAATATSTPVQPQRDDAGADTQAHDERRRAPPTPRVSTRTYGQWRSQQVPNTRQTTSMVRVRRTTPPPASREEAHLVDRGALHSWDEDLDNESNHYTEEERARQATLLEQEQFEEDARAAIEGLFDAVHGGSGGEYAAAAYANIQQLVEEARALQAGAARPLDDLPHPEVEARPRPAPGPVRRGSPTGRARHGVMHGVSDRGFGVELPDDIARFMDSLAPVAAMDLGDAYMDAVRRGADTTEFHNMAAAGLRHGPRPHGFQAAASAEAGPGGSGMFASPAVRGPTRSRNREPVQGGGAAA